MPTLADARRYTDLLKDDTPESAYDYATLFPEGGFLARGRAKKRFKLLKKIDSRIQAILAGRRAFKARGKICACRDCGTEGVPGSAC